MIREGGVHYKKLLQLYSFLLLIYALEIKKIFLAI